MMHSEDKVEGSGGGGTMKRNKAKCRISLYKACSLTFALCLLHSNFKKV